MPSNILAADVLFPHLTEKQSTDEKFTVVTDYLYMLLEQLRYTLANLGEGNFNETELANIGNVITEPVFIQLQGLEGQMASLSVTAEGLASRVSDAEGNISTLTQTANGLNTRVANAEGNISTLTQTANGLSTRVSDAEGNISTLTQTANGLSTRVTNAEGAISEVSVTANKINWLVASGTNATDFTMTDRAINLVAANINLTGYVTFTSLSDQNTTTIINGGNLSACTISSSTFEAKTDIYGNVYGGMDLYCQSYSDIYQVGALNTDILGNQCRVYLRSRSAYGLGLETVLKLYSETNASLEAENMVFIGNGSSTTAKVQIQAPEIKLYGNIFLNDTLVSAKTS